MPRESAPRVWDELMTVGGEFDIHPAGMLALDVARIEAARLPVDVDLQRSQLALVEPRKFSVFELGLERLVQLDKTRFVGQAALREQHRRGPERRIVGLELDWNEVESLYDSVGLAPQIPAAASRVAVPVYRAGRQVGKATSTTWSPTLKKLIA